jgi:hypothetical protein
MDEKPDEKVQQISIPDSSSTDAFVRRARPAFIWLMAISLSLNLTLPLLDQMCGGHFQPLPIDAGLYGLFSSCYLGYVIARSYEKHNDKD